MVQHGSLFRRVIAVTLPTEGFIPNDAIQSITALFLLRPVETQLKIHLHRISKACEILLICPFNLGLKVCLQRQRVQRGKRRF